MIRKNVEFLIKSLLMIGYLSQSNPVKLLFYILYFQAIMVAAFNRKSLQNAHDYLVNHQKNISWEINESGFFRTRLPAEILDFSHPILSELNQTKIVVRTNFWYTKMEGNPMQLSDAAAHDHPNGFMTYLVKNGYTHALYGVASNNASSAECAPNPDQESECATLTIFDKKSKNLFSGGTAQLINLSTLDAKAGDIAIFDDRAIHRILKYKEDTLSLNVVRQDGKYNTNIYLFPGTQAEAKSARVVLTGEDAAVITEQAIQIYRQAILNMDNVTAEHVATIARYNHKPLAPVSSYSFMHKMQASTTPIETYCQPLENKI